MRELDKILGDILAEKERLFPFVKRYKELDQAEEALTRTREVLSTTVFTSNSQEILHGAPVSFKNPRSPWWAKGISKDEKAELQAGIQRYHAETLWDSEIARRMGALHTGRLVTPATVGKYRRLLGLEPHACPPKFQRNAAKHTRSQLALQESVHHAPVKVDWGHMKLTALEQTELKNRLLPLHSQGDWDYKIAKTLGTLVCTGRPVNSMLVARHRQQLGLPPHAAPGEGSHLENLKKARAARQFGRDRVVHKPV